MDALVVMDVETTHYKPLLAKVVEVGAVAFDTEGGELSHFSTMCTPGNEYLDSEALKALEVSGITLNQVLASEPDTVAASKFWKWLDKLSYKGMQYDLAGFNSDGFDAIILGNKPWNISRSLWKYDVMLMAHPIMAEAGALEYLSGMQRYKWPSLAQAREFFEVEREGQPHRALSDARVTAAILFKILKRGR